MFKGPAQHTRWLRLNNGVLGQNAVMEECQTIQSKPARSASLGFFFWGPTCRV